MSVVADTTTNEPTAGAADELEFLPASEAAVPDEAIRNLRPGEGSEEPRGIDADDSEPPAIWSRFVRWLGFEPVAAPSREAVACVASFTSEAAARDWLQGLSNTVDEFDPRNEVMAQVEPGEDAFFNVHYTLLPETYRKRELARLAAIERGDVTIEESLQGRGGGRVAGRAAGGFWRLSKSLAKLIVWMVRRLPGVGRLVKRVLIGPSKSDKSKPKQPRPNTPAPDPFKLDELTSEYVKSLRAKLQAPRLYDVAIIISVWGPRGSKKQLARLMESIQNSLAHYGGGSPPFVFQGCDPRWASSGAAAPKPRLTCVMTAEELGEVARPPDDLTQARGVAIKRSHFKQVEPTRDLTTFADPYDPPPGIIPMGILNPRDDDARVFGMAVEDTNQHFTYFGRTGTGKSELMKWLVFGVAKANYPLVVLDPHGDLTEDLLDALIATCPERVEDVMLLDVADRDFPAAVNPLDVPSPKHVEPAVNAVLEMLDKHMELGAGAPRARYLCQLALVAIAHANVDLDPEDKLTMLDVPAFFQDQELHMRLVELCPNEAVRTDFGEGSAFAEMGEKARMEMLMPIIRAFGTLRGSDEFSAVFGAPQNKLNFSTLISERSIVLCKLDVFGGRTGKFLSALIVPWLLASMNDWGRVRNPETGEREGTGCRLFVDEAAELLDKDSAAMRVMANARKWDFGMFVTTQFPEQLDTEVVKALRANTASKLLLALDLASAKPVADSVIGSSKQLTQSDITELDRFHFAANLLVSDGRGASGGSGAFTAACLPVINGELSREQAKVKALVKERSRARIADDIEERRANADSRVEGTKIALARLMEAGDFATDQERANAAVLAEHHKRRAAPIEHAPRKPKNPNATGAGARVERIEAAPMRTDANDDFVNWDET